MGYQVIRLKKRTTRTSVRAMLRHAHREDIPTNAAEGAGAPQILAGDPNTQVALERLKTALAAAPRVQKNTVQCIEFLVTGNNADMAKLTLGQQTAFFERSIDFLAARFGGRENILCAAVHRDESTPHMQVLAMPRDTEGRFISAKMIGGPAGLKKLHTEFYQEVSQHFGMMRGEEGMGAKHHTIRQFYGQMSKNPSPLPPLHDVPEPPTALDKLRGKAPAIEAARARALAFNVQRREEINRRLAVAENVHPSVVKRQAERYRKMVAAETAAKLDRQAAELANKQAGERLVLADSTFKMAASVSSDYTLAAQRSRLYGKEFVQVMAKNLGIELVPGKDLPDQIRRSGLARTLSEAVNLMDKASHGHVLADAARARQQVQQQANRDADTGDAPLPATPQG